MAGDCNHKAGLPSGGSAFISLAHDLHGVAVLATRKAQVVMSIMDETAALYAQYNQATVERIDSLATELVQINWQLRAKVAALRAHRVSGARARR